MKRPDSSSPSVSVVLPVSGGQAPTPRVLAAIHAALQGTPHEILVVAGEGPDGFDAARGAKWIVLGEAERREPAMLPAMVQALETHELVVGSRDTTGGVRRRIARGLAQLVLNVPLHDPLAGCFGVRREAYAAVASRMNPRGFSVLFELYVRLSQHRQPARVACVEVPYRISGQPADGGPRTRRAVWPYLRMLAELRAAIGWPQGLPKFLCVGAIGLVVNCSALWALVHLASWHYLTAAPVAIEAAILSNFVWHDRWTFRHRRRDASWFARLLRYEVSTSVGLVINWAALGVLVGWWHWWIIPANVTGIGCASLVNFAMGKLWAWKASPGPRLVDATLS